jgi:hypothetical protein
MECILEQRRTFVKRAGRAADRPRHTLAAGRGPRKGLRTEERRGSTAEDKSEDGGMKMEESEERMEDEGWRRENGGGGRNTEVGGWRIHVRT